MTRKTLKIASIAAVFSVLLLAALPGVHAQTCVTDPAEVSPVEVCLEWDDIADPELNLHFTVDFTTDPAQPNVELIEGNLFWRLWALDPADSEGIGNLGDIEAFGAEDYILLILRPDNVTAGARDVKSIVLTPQSGNYSRILPFGSVLSRIRGDVAGDVTVVKSGSDGGTIGLDILGDLGGHLDAPVAATVFIGGNVTSTAQITIEDLTQLALQINYNVGSAGFVDGPITVNVFQGEPAGFSIIDIDGDLNANLTLPFMRDEAELTILGDCSGQIIINENALPSFTIGANSFINIGGELTSTGLIDLGTLANGSGGSKLAGDLTVSGAGAGTIKGITTLESTGSITLGTVSTDDFSGSLAVSTALGPIEIENLSGDVTLSAGSMDILGDFASTGTITLGTAGVEINKQERAGANCDGSITLASSGSSVIVYDAPTGTDGNMTGTLTATGASSAFITVQGDLTGTIDVTGDFDGSIVVGDNMRGDIIARDDYNGTIEIAGALSGDIRVTNNMSSAAAIDVGGELSSTGRIIVNGECDGDITIGEQMARTSQIVLRDFGSNGSIVINDGEGPYDLEGYIYVGSVLVPSEPPWPDVTFDGSILIKKHDASTAGGAIDGQIRVFGCHATTDDLDICECGTSPSINVTIIQDECTNQVDWSCVSSRVARRAREKQHRSDGVRSTESPSASGPGRGAR